MPMVYLLPHFSKTCTKCATMIIYTLLNNIKKTLCYDSKSIAIFKSNLLLKYDDHKLPLQEEKIVSYKNVYGYRREVVFPR